MTMNELIKNKRRYLRISQKELGRRLGYGSGQYISTIERSLCPIPLDRLKQIVKILYLDKKEVIDAMVKDYAARVKRALR